MQVDHQHVCHACIRERLWGQQAAPPARFGCLNVPCAPRLFSSASLMLLFPRSGGLYTGLRGDVPPAGPGRGFCVRLWRQRGSPMMVLGVAIGKAEATAGRWILTAWGKSRGAGAASHRDATLAAPTGKQVLARGAQRVWQPSSAERCQAVPSGVTGKTLPAKGAGVA